jgi:hypothetical protein
MSYKYKDNHFNFKISNSRQAMVAVADVIADAGQL